MNIIKIRHPYQPEQIPEDDVVLVLGFFDGVHIGHQKVIKTGMEIAQKEGLKLALMTFNQHPSIVFKKIDPSSVKYLTSLKQKEEKMADLGIDYLYEVDFTSSFAHLAPQEFVDQYIVGLHAKYAVSGFDYTYGPKDIADVAHFPEYAKGRFKIVTVSKEEEQGEKISSRIARQRSSKRSGKTIRLHIRGRGGSCSWRCTRQIIRIPYSKCQSKEHSPFT